MLPVILFFNTQTIRTGRRYSLPFNTILSASYFLTSQVKWVRAMQQLPDDQQSKRYDAIDQGPSQTAGVDYNHEVQTTQPKIEAFNKKFMSEAENNLNCKITPLLIFKKPLQKTLRSNHFQQTSTFWDPRHFFSWNRRQTF